VISGVEVFYALTFAARDMADISITAASVVPSTNAVKRTGTAGATITAGQLVYKDASDSNKIKLADNDASAAATVVGIALNGASSGQPITYAETDPELTIGATVASLRRDADDRDRLQAEIARVRASNIRHQLAEQLGRRAEQRTTSYGRVQV
jgi:hypothetical protein